MELVSGGWLIPEGALVGCGGGSVDAGSCGVLMREVGARALWWCVGGRLEAGMRGLLGVGGVSGESGV